MENKNIVKQTLKEIEPFLTSLKKERWVKGIVLLGGLGRRNFIDKFSDIDISIFTSEKDKSKFPLPFEFHYYLKNRVLEFNIHQVVLEKEYDKSWEEGKKEAYSRAIIYFDPTNKINGLIRKKTKYNKLESYKRLIWIVQQYKWRGQIHSIRACKRGFPEAGHDLLNECIDLLVESIYIINEKYLPHKKWRLNYLTEMDNAKEIIPVIKKAMIIKKNHISDVNRRIKILNGVFQKVYLLILKKYPQFPKNPYEFYYKNFVQLNPVTPIDILLNQLDTSKEDFEEVKGFLCYNLIDTREKLLKLLLYNDNRLPILNKLKYKYKNELGKFDQNGSKKTTKII